jgi:hypothetical protein
MARKARASFTPLERWLGGLFLKRNHAAPLAALPWRAWERPL